MIRTLFLSNVYVRPSMLRDVQPKLWKSFSTLSRHQTMRSRRARQLLLGSQILPRNALQHLSMLAMKPSDLQNMIMQ
ncbi:hypothetical protein M404DRAFT_719733 [Pisolithus tinctorius Marx 270]|uniref:Uncharacterized protein n=1 Tax=Pisolithus tinctorius Marx 270 TaxID=870435 RepID=A0A0C3JX44_PISTI|nr:hypothetical protein M404DRAFT_719733 [Pisolithus tinctorius Marx 270]